MRKGEIERGRGREGGRVRTRFHYLSQFNIFAYAGIVVAIVVVVVVVIEVDFLLPVGWSRAPRICRQRN